MGHRPPDKDGVVRTFHGRPYPDTSARSTSVADFKRGFHSGLDNMGKSMEKTGEVAADAMSDREVRLMAMVGASVLLVASDPSLWPFVVGFFAVTFFITAVGAFMDWALAGTCRQDEYDDRAMEWFQTAELPPYDYTDTVDLLASELEPEPEPKRKPCLHENTETIRFADTRGTQTVCVDCGRMDAPSPPRDMAKIKRDLVALEYAAERLKPPARRLKTTKR